MDNAIVGRLYNEVQQARGYILVLFSLLFIHILFSMKVNSKYFDYADAPNPLQVNKGKDVENDKFNDKFTCELICKH